MKLVEKLQFILVLMAFLVAAAAPSIADKKVALVIGNSAYQHTPQLKNPGNDARAVSELFSKLGFDTELKLDTDRASFTNTLADFGQLAAGADVAIFYYAGHGVSLDGHNYLIPTDSRIRRAAELKLGAGIDAELAIDQALADAKIKLVFLDACRDNPFVNEIKRSLGVSRSTAIASGLSEMRSGDGTLIAFSTAPGQVALDGSGDTSPFAAAIVKHLAERGLEIRLAMTKVRFDVESETNGKQIPWESTNLTGFYYFASTSSKDTSSTEYTKTAEPDSTVLQSEIEFWRSVKDSHNEKLLRAYIEHFPDGLYRSIAEEQLGEIGAKNQEASASKMENKVNSKEYLGTSPIQSDSIAASAKDTTTEIDDIATVVTPTPMNKSNSSSSKHEAAKGKTPDVSLKRAKTEPKSESPATSKVMGNASPRSNSSSDYSAFLERNIHRNGQIWSVPSGASKAVDASRRKMTIGYKGRQYVCFSSTGMESSVGGVYCRVR